MVCGIIQKDDEVFAILHEKYAPFARNDSYGVCGWHGPPFTFVEWTRIVRRGVAFGMSFATFAIYLTISEWILGTDRATRYWSQQRLSWWFQWGMARLGFEPLVIIDKSLSGLPDSLDNPKTTDGTEKESKQLHSLPRLPQAPVLVSNHVGYLDVPFLYQVFPCSFIAKKAVRDVPAIGTLSRVMQAVFVSHPSARSKSQQEQFTNNHKKCNDDEMRKKFHEEHTTSADELISKTQSLANRIQTRKVPNDNNNNYTDQDGQGPSSPPPLLVFPEGTTTNGSHILPFRTGAFAAGVTVQPLLLEFPFSRFNPSWESINLWTSLLRLLAQPSNRCVVTILPPILPPLELVVGNAPIIDKEDTNNHDGDNNDNTIKISREERKRLATIFANQARDVIAKAGNLKKSDLVYKDKKSYHEELRKRGYY